MSFDAFGTGIRLGGLRDLSEIKILICYLLFQLGSPVSEELLGACFQLTGDVNYFDYRSALAELLEMKQVKMVEKENEKPLIAVTELGEYTAKSLDKSVPLSVRERTLVTLRDLMQRKINEDENKVDIIRTEDGFILSIKIPDVGTDLLNLSLFLPDQKAAQQAAEKFLEDPAECYRQILSLFGL